MPKTSAESLSAFVAVAELSSFTVAATRLQVSPSAVSQSIRALEQRLGVALLNRSTRSVSLTEAGARYLERIAGPLKELDAAAEDLGGDADKPSGVLRLNVARAAYMTVMRPVLAPFLDVYPDIQVEMVIDNTVTDITARGFDAGIRFSDLVAGDMVAVPVGPPLSAQVIASPDYIARRGAPSHPKELLGHDCVAFQHATSGQMEQWAFQRGEERFELAIRGRLIVNDSTAMAQAVLDGAGIGYMASGFIERFIEDGRLVRLLPDWSPRVPGFVIYYPSRRRAPRKLRVLVDFLRAQRYPLRPDADATYR
ncbi:MAG TPA: LysR family transcriptional regulator [Caulobacteraceae bacterium]|jgi:DNA-binding transcriptional LysR family regulator